MTGMIKPKFHHVTLKTTRLQQMVDWYRKLIGVEVNFQDQNNAWTSNDEANHRVAFLSVPGLSDDSEKVAHKLSYSNALWCMPLWELMRHLLRSEQLRIEAQRARKNAHRATSQADKEFWQRLVAKWERLAVGAEVHRKKTAA